MTQGPEGSVPPDALDAMRAVLGSALPEHGRDGLDAVEDLVQRIPDGAVTSGGPRRSGGAGRDAESSIEALHRMVTVLDRRAVTSDSASAASLAAETALRWVTDLLGLPALVSGGFTSGSTTAHTSALLAARTHLLAQRGWDVEAHGLTGAPELPIIVSADAHGALTTTLRHIGFGEQRLHRVPTDDQGRMRMEELRALLVGTGDAPGRAVGPALVCVATGGIDTGAFDHVDRIAELTRRRGDWLHVDGASGLWAAATPGLAHLASGSELADSWTVDAHGMLPVPHDGRIVLCAHPEAHRRALASAAPCTVLAPPEPHPATTRAAGVVPDAEHRTVGIAVWAALRTLGRQGVADLVQRRHDLAVRTASLLQNDPLITIPHEVVFDRLLVDVAPHGLPPATAARFVQEVVDRIGAAGACRIDGARRRGRPVLRVSVVDHRTTTADVDASAVAIRGAVDVVRARYRPDFLADIMPAFVAQNP